MKSGLHVMIAAAMVALLLCSTGGVLAASMTLNEYNAVKSDTLLKNGGTDTYFGTVTGNGGDWMEFVVIQDMLDIRGWYFTTSQDGATDATIVIPDLVAFSGLRSGTILTIAESVATDLTYNPIYDASDQNAGDWWINCQAAFSAGDSTHKNFQVAIYDAMDNLVFGPAGEGVSPADGIGSDEVCKLEDTPSASTTPYSNYKDGTSSTFGGPNLWSSGTVTQDLSPLRRCLVPEPASLLALACGILPVILGKRRNSKR